MTEPRSPHIVLVGLPGSGKTTVGRGVAALLRRPFLDFDEELERRSGRSVAEIFEEGGESSFRSQELELTRELASETTGMVLSPGGGWAAVPGAIGLLRPPAWLAYLQVTPRTALRRLNEGSGLRPLLAGPNPLGVLTALLEQRRVAYESADAVVDVELIDTKDVMNVICVLAPVSGSE